jgi:hypothetical protein
MSDDARRPRPYGRRGRRPRPAYSRPRGPFPPRPPTRISRRSARLPAPLFEGLPRLSRRKASRPRPSLTAYSRGPSDVIDQFDNRRPPPGGADAPTTATRSLASRPANLCLDPSTSRCPTCYPHAAEYKVGRAGDDQCGGRAVPGNRMRPLTTRRTGVAAVAGTILVLSLIVLDTESHRTNVRYLVWKHFALGDWEKGVRFLNVDSDFRRSFEGQPRSYLLRWFPDLRPGSSRRHICPDTSEWAAANDGQDRGEWIGDSPWLVVYDTHGAVKEIALPKGC